MRNTFIAISLILSIFFISNKALSVIMTDKNKFQPVKKIDSNLRIALGKKLFFDPFLSKDGTVSCASCHKPEHGFADDKPVSTGIKGQNGDRNTPTAFNTAKLKFLFWDGRVKSLEEQALGPIQNPLEMGEKIENVVNKLNNLPFYVSEFEKAFGEGEITKEKLAVAIAEFERTLISKDSDYDRFIAGDKKALSKSAKQGYDLFFGKAMCAECHKGPDFTDGDFHNIGLPITNDVGRSKISINGKDTRKFKTPTLREVANTAPYFHSGQFETLEQVIVFYNAGGGVDSFKDPLKKPLNLNEQEQKDLVEFLKSLSGRQPKILPPDPMPHTLPRKKL